MPSIQSLVQKTNRAINKWRFERALKHIDNTKPIALGNDSFTALSMVHHRDVDSYLLSIKSFCMFLHPNRIVVVTDPSVTNCDRERIAGHVQGIQFVSAEQYRDPDLPIGGTWERLIAISEYVKDDFVVQIDADTVALSEMSEVRKAISESCSFVLSTEDNQEFQTCSQIAKWAKPRVSSEAHVQLLAEANLDQTENAGTLRYVRGCSGFSGFARGSFGRANLIALSAGMKRILGERWSEWGTEQFSSNFIIANSPKSTVLPHPKYCHPGRETTETVFLHFIGYVRFSSGRYASAARQTFAALQR